MSTKCGYCMSLSGTGMQKIKKFGPYVLEVQESRKPECQWPYLYKTSS